MQRVEAEHGTVGVLVDNAGHGGGGPVEEVPLSMVRETFDTNVFSAMRMCQLVLPGMRPARRLRLEVAPFGIRVVLIEPGAVRTHFLASRAARR